MATKTETFLSRLPSGSPPHVASDIAIAFQIVDRFGNKVVEIHNDRALTLAGKAIAIEKALTSGPLGHLAQLRENVEKRLADATGQRKVLRERVLNSDTFPEARKFEVRLWLRELPNAERMSAVSADDPLIRESVLSAPFYLSGVPEALWNAAADKAVEAVHGEHLRQIDVLETAYSEARAAMRVAHDDLRRESGIDEHEFAKIAA